MEFPDFRRKEDWYFEGYRSEYVPKGNGKGKKRVFIYEGPYYSFQMEPAKLKHFKIRILICCILCILSYLAMTLVQSYAFYFFYIGGPIGLNILPLIYLSIGSFCLFAADDPLTLRQNYGSVRRVRRSVYFCTIFSAVSCLGNVFFLITCRGAYPLLQEIGFFAVNLLSLICFVIILYSIRSHPLNVISKKKDHPDVIPGRIRE